ncbi:protein LURP-one-related 10-like [Rutidosis leptorrhynchoides]|uniref:protein LURP-one-related 10-like n=1 Tax=Rutidosis leptorrhynchoides TaxID=125765 RepID=UPI003A98DC72
MAQSNNPSISVIGSQFTAPNPLEVKVVTNCKGTIVITDNNENILLQVTPCDGLSCRRRLLMDANGTPIVTIDEDGWSFHLRWNVYRGKSTAKSDLIFTTKRKHASLWFKSRVNVYLAHNTSSEHIYDYKIKGDWHKNSCAVYKGYSTAALAQMHTGQHLKKQKLDKFMVTISPNVDYAFVAALFVIVDAMESPYKNERVAAGETAVGISKALLEIVTQLTRPS